MLRQSRESPSEIWSWRVIVSSVLLIRSSLASVH